MVNQEDFDRLLHTRHSVYVRTNDEEWKTLRITPSTLYDDLDCARAELHKAVEELD